MTEKFTALSKERMSERMTSKVDYYGPSMRLAYEFYDLALEEFKSQDMLRKCDGCEKAYRAATEAIDVLLATKGITIPAGHP